MPRDGSGVHTLPSGYLAVTGETVLPSNHNPPLEDLSAAITESIARTGVTAITANIPFNDKKITGLGDATADTDALNRRTGDARYLTYAAECRLIKDGTDIRLIRMNGSRVVINGASQVIPSAGVSLAPTGLTPSTLYYIYAYMVSTTMTLEASATGHSTDTSTGVEIKTGDATRTLVGMVYPITGPAFAETSAQRLVISWFNRRPIYGTGRFSTIRTSTSTSYAEINSEIRVQFLCWADQALQFAASGGAYNSGVNQTLTSIGIDSATVPQDVAAFGSGVNAQPVGLVHSVTLAEGYHYATVLGRVSAGTGNWYTNTDNAGERFTLKVVTYG